MIKYHFILPVLLLGTTLTFLQPDILYKGAGDHTGATSGKIQVNKRDTLPFALQPKHPANILDGCTVSLNNHGKLSFNILKPGKSLLVLKASAPLIIVSQSGVSARLKPGWDGTLGYSLYALYVETSAPGAGTVELAAEPVQPGLEQPQEEFNARTSRFPDNKNQFVKWQKDYRERLAALLMNGGFPRKIPLAAEVTENIGYKSFILRRVKYQSQKDRSNTLLLSVPRNVKGRVPLLITLHGHEATWGEADSGAFRAGHPDDFCAYFAERGWAVLQPATMNHTLRQPGWTLQGEWTWDAIVAIDYAVSLPDIDPDQIAVCGLSTGGHLAMNLLALDDRVRAGVIGCVLSTWHHYHERMRIPPHCDCGISGQLGDWLEECDWAALAAPKPVMFQYGRKDACYCPGADPSLLDPDWNTSVMPEKEFKMMFSEVERAYQMNGNKSNLSLFFHDEGHRVNNEAAFKFLNSLILRHK